jgi:phage terminase small subunit
VIPKRRRFVEEYLKDLNATQAAVRAGYTTRTAKAAGCKLLTFSDVKAAVEAAIEERRKKSEVTAEYVLTNLREVVERCLQRAPVVTMKGEQVMDEEGRSVWEFNAPGANKALELLGKHLGMFTEKVQVAHSGEMSMTAQVRAVLLEREKEREK